MATCPIDLAKTRAVEFGISCEACHGPGKKHIDANRNPLRRYEHHLSDQPDATIVQPARLSNELSSQVCGQCHSLSNFRSAEAHLKWAQDGYEYRPGQDLSSGSMRMIYRCCAGGSVYSDATAERLADYTKQFWSDGMARVSGSEYNGLVETPCFQHGEMSCLSCHTMHQSADDPRPRKEWANDQLKPQMVHGHDACLQCHDSFADESALQAHTHHPVSSAGSNCYNCHMSYTTYGLVKAIRSHQIDSPDVSTSLATGRPNACNQCHLDETLAWTAEHLTEWYSIDSPDIPADEQEIAASVLWSLRGDAGQRALMAWSFGWPEAQEASGTDWMGPCVAQLLTDPYDAVRLMAGRSLRSIAEFDSVEYDYVGQREDLNQTRRSVLELWQRASETQAVQDRRRLLLDERGQLIQDEFDRLHAERDDRPVSLAE